MAALGASGNEDALFGGILGLVEGKGVEEHKPGSPGGLGSQDEAKLGSAPGRQKDGGGSGEEGDGGSDSGFDDAEVPVMSGSPRAADDVSLAGTATGVNLELPGVPTPPSVSPVSANSGPPTGGDEAKGPSPGTQPVTTPRHARDEGAADGALEGHASPTHARRTKKKRRATILELDDLDAAIAGAEEDIQREAKGERVKVGQRRRTELLRVQQLAQLRAAETTPRGNGNGSGSGGGWGDDDDPSSSRRHGAQEGAADPHDFALAIHEPPPRGCWPTFVAGTERRLLEYRAWVAQSDHDVRWYHRRTVALAALMVLDLVSSVWMVWALLATGHTGWAALAIAMMALGTMVAGWAGEVVGGEPSSNCPYPRCMYTDPEERKLFWCCMGVCHAGYTGMVATIMKAKELNEIVPVYRALLLLKVYHGLWQSLPLALLASYVLSQMGSVPRILDDFSTAQRVAVSLSWLLSTASTAVAVAVQRVDGSAIDSKPMFRHLELPFSRLTVEVFSCAHTVLRMLLVFWFSAAYRGYMFIGLCFEAFVKFVFSMSYCPLQRFPTDRTAAVASLVLVWTPMNLIVPYSVHQRFRPRFPVALMLLQCFTDTCLLVLPTIPWTRPDDNSSMTGAPTVTHGFCWSCDSAETTMLTSCCTNRLAIWPFVLMCILFISVYALTYRAMRLDQQTEWFDRRAKHYAKRFRRCRRKTWRKTCGRCIKQCRNWSDARRAAAAAAAAAADADADADADGTDSANGQGARGVSWAAGLVADQEEEEGERGGGGLGADAMSRHSSPSSPAARHTQPGALRRRERARRKSRVQAHIARGLLTGGGAEDPEGKEEGGAAMAGAGGKGAGATAGRGHGDNGDNGDSDSDSDNGDGDGGGARVGKKVGGRSGTDALNATVVSVESARFRPTGTAGAADDDGGESDAKASSDEEDGDDDDDDDNGEGPDRLTVDHLLQIADGRRLDAEDAERERRQRLNASTSFRVGASGRIEGRSTFGSRGSKRGEFEV